MKKLEKGIEGDLDVKDAHRNFMPTTLNIPFVMLMFAYIYIYICTQIQMKRILCVLQTNSNVFLLKKEKKKKRGFLEFERKIK